MLIGFPVVGRLAWRPDCSGGAASGGAATAATAAADGAVMMVASRVFAPEELSGKHSAP